MSNAELQRPADILDGAAADAWQSYNAMEATKQRHYQLLEALDNKKKHYDLDATVAETVLLANMLADHSGQVKRFSTASLSLKKSDPRAHRALFDYVAAINDVVVKPPVTH